MNSPSKSLINIILILIVVISMVGCIGHWGNSRIENDDYLVKIEKWKTTKAEVIEILGEPKKRRTGEGLERWTYVYSPCIIPGRETLTTVNIYFSSDGRVIEVYREGGVRCCFVPRYEPLANP